MRVRTRVGRTTLAGYAGFRRVRDKVWSVLISGAFASFGERSVLALPIRLAGVSGMTIGSHVYVGAGSWLQILSKEGGSGRLVLGDGTRISGGVVITVAREVTLGNSVLLAKNVYISDHIHAHDDPDLPIVDQGITGIAPVHIGDGAWLGQGVVVVPGVTIGAGCVVGANSVVTTDLPPRTLAVGAPARIVRHLDEGKFPP